MTEPIRQEIKADYDGSAVEEAARDMQKVESATEKSGQAAQKATGLDQRRGDQLKRLEDQLRDNLTREEQLLRRQNRGIQLTEEEQREINRLRQRRNRLSRAISEEEDRRSGLNRRVRENIDSHKEHNISLTDSLGKINQLIPAIGGAAGIAAAYRVWIDDLREANELLKENARLTGDVASASVNLAFLGVSPEDREVVQQATAEAGRDPQEGLRTFADIVSRRPSLDRKAQLAILDQVLESGQTTDAPLQSIANAILTVERFTADAQQAQNIVFQTIKDAGVSDPAKLSPLFARLLGVGTEIGGLSEGQVGGLLAGVTGLGLEPSEAVVGTRNLILALSGKGTPEGNKILQREGVSRDDFLLSLQQIASASESGRITNEELESIAGREAIAVTTALSDTKRLKELLTLVENGRLAQASADDLTQDEIQRVLGEDALIREDLGTRKQKYLAQNEQTSVLAAQQERARKTLDHVLLQKVNEGAITAGERERIAEEFDYQLARGLSVEEAIRVAENAPPIGVRVPFSGKKFPLDFGITGSYKRGQTDVIEAPFLEEFNQPQQPTVIIENQYNGPVNNMRGGDPVRGNLENKEPR